MSSLRSTLLLLLLLMLCCVFSKFDRLRTFVLFTGYQRSGSTLIAALLDQHPQVVVTHEFDVLRRWGRTDGSRNDLIQALVDQSETDARRAAFVFTSYNFSCAQRQFDPARRHATQLVAIGDKKAGNTALQLFDLGAAKAAKLLARLATLLEADIKFFHAVRNPFDIIATKAVRKFGSQQFLNRFIGAHGTNHSVPHPQTTGNATATVLDISVAKLNPIIDEFVQQHKASLSVRETWPTLDVYSHLLVANPQAQMKLWCKFVGANNCDEWVAGCQSVIAKQVFKSRHRIRWPPEVAQRLQAIIDGSEMLHGYSFDSES